MHRRLFLARAGLVTVPFLLGAKTRVRVADRPPRPEDVGSVDGILNAYYDVISGPAGAPREWGRDRSLYVPGIRFVSVDDEGGKARVRVMTHQEYVDATDPKFVAEGFFEKEIHRTQSGWGRLLQVRSTYDSRRAKDGPVIARGVNFLQLWRDDVRWWIASAIWQDESKSVPLAGELLPG